MAELHLVTLSEASGNDTEKQRWLLDRVCSRVHYLGKVTLTTVGSTYDELSTLITRLARLYDATGNDFHEVNDWLSEKLTEVEARYKPEEIARAQAVWKRRETGLEMDDLELDLRRGDELKQRPLRSFFNRT